MLLLLFVGLLVLCETSIGHNCSLLQKDNNYDQWCCNGYKQETSHCFVCLFLSLLLWLLLLLVAGHCVWAVFGRQQRTNNQQVADRRRPHDLPETLYAVQSYLLDLLQAPKQAVSNCKTGQRAVMIVVVIGVVVLLLSLLLLSL